jgi:GNAT superfamily N-acetyltransferase
MIAYKDALEPLDLNQLASLFDRVGWQRRTRDRARLAQMVDGSTYRVAAFEGGVLVGFARAISDGAFNAYVGTVAVLPEYQRQGIGRELLRRLLEGRDHIQFVLHADPRVHPFYLRCGFRLAPDMLRVARRY